MDRSRSARAAIDTVVLELGAPTIVVLNAGIFLIEPIEPSSSATCEIGWPCSTR